MEQSLIKRIDAVYNELTSIRSQLSDAASKTTGAITELLKISRDVEERKLIPLKDEDKKALYALQELFAYFEDDTEDKFLVKLLDKVAPLLAPIRVGTKNHDKKSKKLAKQV